MNFAFSEEQEELRRITRQFLESKSPESEVRRLMDTDEGYDPAVWGQMANELGLQSLIIPEEYGGQGFTFVELTVVLEEMGRALLCAPYFSSCVLAASALLHSGDDAAKKEHLPGIASGETIATLAFTEPNGKWDESGIETTATKDGDGYKLNGTKMFVLDGAQAGLLIVAAKSDSGVSLFAVDPNGSGVTRTNLATMDQTRKQAKIDTPAPVRAATRSRLATWPSSTNIFVPLMVHPSPDWVAVASMPASSHLPFGSVKASVAIVSPDAMPGRCSFLAASSPAWSRVVVASTADEKYGAHRSARPISSRTTVSSTKVKPWPPNSSGTIRLWRPSSLAIWLQTAGS